MAQVEKDALTGTDTTGHEWDGIKELNTPLPKWWLYTLFATIIWAIGYWVVYPSWPMANDYLKGVWGYSSRMAHDADLAEQAKGRAEWTDKLTGQSLDEIWADTDLRNYAIAGGQFIFNENCAPCHGAGGQGQLNFPTLADDDWIWGGGLDEIFETIRVGIRSTHDDTRFAEMPAFGADELLTPEQISVVADYVLDLPNMKPKAEAPAETPTETPMAADGTDAAEGGDAADAPEAAEVAMSEGEQIWAEEAGCSACHGEDGKGDPAAGGPNLTDAIWLFGNGSKEAIVAQISKPKHGVMPFWEDRLTETERKMAAIYVHSRGADQ